MGTPVLDKLKAARDNLNKCECKCDPSVGVVCESCRDHDLFGEAIRELEQLQEDIQYALDRLSVKADQGPGLRVLIDDATNCGDYFPAYELKRQKEQFDALNKQLGETTIFIEGITAEHKARKLELEQLQTTVESFQWKPGPPTLPGWHLRRKPPSDLIVFKQVTSFNGVLVTSHKERGKRKKLTSVDLLPDDFLWLGPIPSLTLEEDEPNATT